MAKGKTTEAAQPRTLAELAAAAAEIRAGHDREYRALVREAGRGGDVQPEQVVEVCARAGVALEQFQADAEVIERRLTLRATLDRTPELERARSAVQSKLAGVADEFERARQKR